MTRRERRAAEAAQAHATEAPSASASTDVARTGRDVARPAARTAPASAARPARPSRWRRWRSTLVMMIVVPGLFAAFALPGSTVPASEAAPLFPDQDQDRTVGSQSLSVDDEATAHTVSRDVYGATSNDDIAEAKEKEAEKQRQKEEAERQAAADAEEERQENEEKRSSYDGPSADDNLSDPSDTEYSGSAVIAEAKKYIGTPYVYGGADPSGFDCSGLIMYVFSKFGISLPHGVGSQDAAGTTVSESEAKPGDLVIFGGHHDGFYLGDGMILDAPKPGKNVQIRPIWSEAHHFVRIDG